MNKDKQALDTKNKLSAYYRSADKYSERLESHSESAYAEARTRECANLRFFCADILKIPFKNETFDCVYAFLVIEHIPDIPQVIEEMLRVTKQGGRIIILSPNLLSPFNVLLPLFDFILGKKANFLFGVNNFWGMLKLLCRHTGLIIKKSFNHNPEFTYRQPILENRVDFIADNDAVYLACPIDFKRYFNKLGDTKIDNYQGYGRIGGIFPDLATGIHLSVRKL